jgi:hypothetical protein
MAYQYDITVYAQSDRIPAAGEARRLANPVAGLIDMSAFA